MGRTGHDGNTVSDQEPGALAILGAGYLVAIACGVLMPVIDSTLVSVGMDTLVEAFGSDTITMQWVSTSYLLALAAVVPITSWALIRWSGRRLWLGCLVLFVISSACCAASTTAAALIGFRAIQGIAAGMILPLTQTLPVMEARRAGITRTAGIVATISLPISLGPVLGPAVGGIILNSLSWHWLFLVNIPLGILAILLALRFIPKSAGGTEQTERLDLVGLALIAIGLVLVLLGLANIASQPTSVLVDVALPIVAGMVLIAIFCQHTLRRTDSPLVNIRLLALPASRAASIASFFFGVCLYAAQFVLPLWWQQMHGATVFETGEYMMAQGIGVLVSRIFVRRIIDRFGDRAVSVTAFLLLAATTLPFCIAHDAPTAPLIALLFVRGLAQGTVNIPINSAVYVGLSPEQVPHGTILVRTMQQVGSSFGTALVAMALQSISLATGGSGDQSTPEGFVGAVCVLAGAAVVGAIVSCMLPKREDEDV